MNRVDADTKGGIEDLLASVTGSENSLSPLQLHFLRRLSRLLRLRSDQSGQLNEDGLRLIDRAIYSSYCDAVDVGAAAEAQKLLHHSAAAASSRPAGKK